MSKIICDICGTSYPETAKQCPICGCVRPGDVQRVTNEIKADGKGATGYTYVKGGRFSKSNVKKRGKANGSRAAGRTTRTDKNNAKEPQSNRGMVIAAIVLLLAIIGVVIYIAVGFFGTISGSDTKTTTPSGTASALDLSCRGITLSTEMVILEPGEGHLLDYKLQPANTTDKPIFRSENPEIATVSDKGNITAVAEGTTKIIITCGKAEKEITVYCQYENDSSVPTVPTAPTTPTDPSSTTAPTTKPSETIRLNRKDMSLFFKGETWDLYSGDVAKNLVTFTSENENVVTFVDGIVTAVGGSSEYVWVHAEYNGQKVSCKILCQFKESGGTTGNGGVSPDEDETILATGKIINVQEFVNVRSGPGTGYDQVGTLKLGAQVTITKKAYDTGNMEWGKTEAGWVRMDFIKIDTN